MAYLRFDDLGSPAGTYIAGRSVPTQPAFSPLEQHVVALAMSDTPSSLRTATRPILDMLIGPRPSRRLADPRLEALRRFVVLHRHGHADLAQAAGEAAQHGYDAVLLERLQRRIAPIPTRKGTVSAWPLLLLAMLVFGVIRLTDYLGEILPAIVVTLTLIVPFIGMALSSSRQANSRR